MKIKLEDRHIELLKEHGIDMPKNDLTFDQALEFENEVRRLEYNLVLDGNKLASTAADITDVIFNEIEDDESDN